MPIYDYECGSCTHHFEKSLKMSEVDVPLSEPCPSCSESNQIQQVLGCNPFIDSVKLGIKKPDRTFQRDIIGRIKKNTPHNNIGKSNFAKFDIPGRV